MCIHYSCHSQGAKLCRALQSSQQYEIQVIVPRAEIDGYFLQDLLNRFEASQRYGSNGFHAGDSRAPGHVNMGSTK